MNCSQKAEGVLRLCPTLRVFFFSRFPCITKQGLPPPLPSLSDHMCPWSLLLGLTDSRLGERRKREGARQKKREKDRARWWESTSVLQQRSGTNPAEEVPPPARWESQCFFPHPSLPLLHYSFHLLHNSLALPDSLLPAPAVALWIIFQPRTGVPILYRPPLISAAMDSQQLSDLAKSCREDGLCLLFCY